MPAAVAAAFFIYARAPALITARNALVTFGNALRVAADLKD
jgi:hypothetical protein